MNRIIITNTSKLIKYNLKVIFGGKFIWFLLFSIVLYIISMFQMAYSGENITEGKIFNLMLLPSFLIIFYPSVFSIQNDADNKILEILFGIPNYRYKVWGMRLLIIFSIQIIMQYVFSQLTTIFLYPVDCNTMVYNSFLPIFFFACIAFMLSTILKNGNATALLLILIFLIASGFADNNSEWNILINPLKEQKRLHPDYWNYMLIKNKIILLVASISTILIGFYNLQNREKFV